jgi:hypothetical protein
VYDNWHKSEENFNWRYKIFINEKIYSAHTKLFKLLSEVNLFEENSNKSKITLKNGGVGLKLNMTFTAMEMLNLNIELLVRGKYIINVKSEMICMKSLDIKGENIRF